MRQNQDYPPAYPAQAHLDAGAAPAQPSSPYNAYGGFANSSANKPDQSHLDPRAGPGGPYASPAQQGYYSPAPTGPYAALPQPQVGYGPPPQQMYYGPPQQQQGYYGQGAYGPPQGGYSAPRRGYHAPGRGGEEGICAGIFGALTCCGCRELCLVCSRSGLGGQERLLRRFPGVRRGARRREAGQRQSRARAATGCRPGGVRATSVGVHYSRFGAVSAERALGGSRLLESAAGRRL